ncbi:hypothetical protein SCHPADRAFT_868685 [Schizopora paradoxa]|uniref:BHLH domain-containing protein n=1 Tax=Schizopora paradoxa TaxID=27342 RepID=A0A0H2SJ83_9AGAM|nr:hypothetical protein SCHPADRAFT_868685 [Schizopora paradoxa]
MPLFTPSESYALQTFLEHIDITGALDGMSSGETEWPAIYSAGSEASSSMPNGVHHFQASPVDSSDNHPTRITSPTQTNYPPRSVGGEVLVPKGHEQLAKAAKDLMSLDSNPLKWTDSADHDLPCPPRLNQEQDRHSASPVHQSRTTGHARSNSALSQTHYPASSSSNGRPRLAVAPSSSSHSVDGFSAYESLPSGSSVNSSDTSPPPLTPPSAKRPYDAIHHHQDPSSSSSLAKKARSNSSSIPPHANNPNVPIINTKPTLLSASQKKANHIQSEQKRRANIRRGYEALCDTVPALREAIRREEEEQRMVTQATAHASGGGGDSAGKVKKKLRARRKVTDGAERMDGRAGPRSENIVLSKTIDYIHDLLSDKASLLDRLSRARTVLARSAPERLQPPIEGVPLWEREWGGGVGLLDPEGGGDSDDDVEDS